MSEEPISDLRCRMLEDMAVRKLGEKTRHDYIRHVEAFASFLGRSPDTATAEDVRRFLIQLLYSCDRDCQATTVTKGSEIDGPAACQRAGYAHGRGSALALAVRVRDRSHGQSFDCRKDQDAAGAASDRR